MVAQNSDFLKREVSHLQISRNSMLDFYPGGFKKGPHPPGTWRSHLTCQASCKAFWKSVIPNSHKMEPFLGKHPGFGDSNRKFQISNQSKRLNYTITTYLILKFSRMNLSWYICLHE